MTTAPELSTAEAAKVAEFDAAPEPPEIAAIAPLLAKLRAVENIDPLAYIGGRNMPNDEYARGWGNALRMVDHLLRRALLPLTDEATGLQP